MESEFNIARLAQVNLIRPVFATRSFHTHTRTHTSYTIWKYTRKHMINNLFLFIHPVHSSFSILKGTLPQNQFTATVAYRCPPTSYFKRYETLCFWNGLQNVHQFKTGFTKKHIILNTGQLPNSRCEETNSIGRDNVNSIYNVGELEGQFSTIFFQDRCVCSPSFPSTTHPCLKLVDQDVSSQILLQHHAPPSRWGTTLSPQEMLPFISCHSHGVLSWNNWSRVQCPLLAFTGTACTWCAYTHAGKPPPHTKIKKNFSINSYWTVTEKCSSTILFHTKHFPKEILLLCL